MKSIFRNLATFTLLIFSFLLVSVSFAKAQDNQTTDSATIIDSYTLFWPLAPGKTEADSLYSLKLLKEQVLGWLTFGENKKADYAIMLGTKRVLEAEKLIKDGKTDLALKSIDRAGAEYSSAYNYIKSATSKGKFSAQEIRRDRLVNMKSLLDNIKGSTSQDTQAKLENVKEKTNAILRDYLP